MNTAEKQLPRMTVDELMAICALNERVAKLDLPLSHYGLPADAATLANALFLVDDITLELAVKKHRAICRRRAQEFGL